MGQQGRAKQQYRSTFVTVAKWWCLYADIAVRCPGCKIWVSLTRARVGNFRKKDQTFEPIYPCSILPHSVENQCPHEICPKCGKRVFMTDFVGNAIMAEALISQTPLHPTNRYGNLVL